MFYSVLMSTLKLHTQLTLLKVKQHMLRRKLISLAVKSLKSGKDTDKQQLEFLF